MPKYKVTVTETVVYEEPIEADSETSARDLAENLRVQGSLIFSHVNGVDIHVVKVSS